MKKMLTFALLGLATAAVSISSAAAQPQAAQAKVWLCHKTGATSSTSAGTFTKFVPIRVTGRALVRAHRAHGDVPVAPAPSGTLTAQRQAAKTFCNALRVAAPITPTRGGVVTSAALSGGGVTASLTARAQVGRKRLCFTLALTGPAGATFELTSLTLSQGTTTIAIPSTSLTGARPSGCITLADRALARQILAGGFTATLSGNFTPTGGSATAFQASGALHR